MANLTDQERRDIEKKLGAGVPVGQLGKLYEGKVSIPTLYNLKKKILKSTLESTTLTASDLVRKAISQAEQEVAEIQKQIENIDHLRDELKAKKAFLESLKKLESGK